MLPIQRRYLWVALYWDFNAQFSIVNQSISDCSNRNTQSRSGTRAIAIHYIQSRNYQHALDVLHAHRSIRSVGNVFAAMEALRYS